MASFSGSFSLKTAFSIVVSVFLRITNFSYGLKVKIVTFVTFPFSSRKVSFSAVKTSGL